MSLAVYPMCDVLAFFFFFQAEDGIRDLVRSRGLGDVYKRQIENLYVLDRGQRRLFTLANLLPRALSARLHKWVDLSLIHI